MQVCLVMGVLLTGTLRAQSTPTDLTNLRLEDILAMRIIPHDEAIEASRIQEPFRFGYHYVHAEFEDYRDGTRRMSLAEVGTLYPVVPVEITQNVHLLTLGYQVHSRLYIDLELSYVRQRTYHISRVPGFDEFTIHTHGVGDSSIGLTYLVWEKDDQKLFAGAALSIPTGSIGELGGTPRDPNRDTLVPFTMQIGSGTFDFNPSLAYIRQMGRFEWNNHLQGTIRMGRNYHGYSLSHRATFRTALSYHWLPHVIPSIKLLGHYWDRIHGRDVDLILPNGVFPAPVTNPQLFGGRKLDFLVGFRFPFDQGMFKGQSIEVEAGLPVYQYLNGPQPGEKWRVAASWNWQF